MLRTPTVLTACAAALAAGGTVAAAQGGPAPTSTQDLTFKNPSLHNTYVDTGTKGPTTGDYVVDSGALDDPASGAAKGTIINSCLLVKIGKRNGYSCRGGVELAGGRIAISLIGTREEKVSTFAIDGGTGAYATARGTVVTTPLSSKDGGPSRIEVHIIG